MTRGTPKDACSRCGHHRYRHVKTTIVGGVRCENCHGGSDSPAPQYHAFRKRAERTKLRELDPATRALKRQSVAACAVVRARRALVAAAAALVRAERRAARLAGLAQRRSAEAVSGRPPRRIRRRIDRHIELD